MYTTTPAKNKECYFCSTLFDARNDSKEHIIPNALGGKMVISSFICKNCNNRCGGDGDAKLSNHLSWFAVMLQIIRDRGTLPKVKGIKNIHGDERCVLENGQLTLNNPLVSKDSSGKILEVRCRTWKEAVQKIKEIAKKGQYPENVLPEIKEHFAIEPIQMEFCGFSPEIMKSVVKTAVSYAFSSDPSLLNEIMVKEYLTSEESPLSKSFGSAYPFYFQDPVKNRIDNPMFHCVALIGDPVSQKLIAYVEYFSHFRVLVELSTQYRGQPLEKVYGLDPSTGYELSLVLDREVLLSNQLKNTTDIRTAIEQSLRNAINYCSLQQLSRSCVDICFDERLSVDERNKRFEKIAKCVSSTILQNPLTKDADVIS